MKIDSIVDFGATVAFERASIAKPVVAQSSTPAQQPASPEAVKQAVAQIEAYLRSIDKALEFSIDQGTGRTVVTLRDAKTGDVVRQIPGEDALRISEQLGKQLGSLLSVKA